MELIEGVGESSSPTRSFGSMSGYDIKNDVYNRLMESGNEEAVSNPDLREQLEAHFSRLPPRYFSDINVDRVEDVLLHQKLLAQAKDPEKRPVFHVRFLENLWTRADGNEDQQVVGALSASRPSLTINHEGHVAAYDRSPGIEFEPCSKLKDLGLDARQSFGEMEGRLEVSHVPVHEVVFSTVDKPKLLSQLSALLSDIGLNIREAHVFSTTDGYSLDVFVVDGWPTEAAVGRSDCTPHIRVFTESLFLTGHSCGQDTDGLRKAVEDTIARNEGSCYGSSYSQSAVEKMLPTQAKHGNWEIDRKLLKIGEKIASGSCGDLYRGVYLGEDVAIKILRSKHLTEASGEEFVQEVAILREVQHKNVVRFIGACTKSPHLCIVTEYLPGGSLYNYLHKDSRILEFCQLLKFAIDVCKGMEYLHYNNIIHRDLKTANLLMDTHQVVKVADFGVARFLNQEGVMTAETGTYRWMAPEVINHQPYDQKADVFSFAVVLWEFVTAKVPYETMTPLQAALGVRQGLRPDLPQSMHPKLSDLMQRCWDAAPSNRPPFSIIRTELEGLLSQVQDTTDAASGG